MTQATEKQISYIQDLTKVSKLGTTKDAILSRATLNFDLTKEEASDVITFLKLASAGKGIIGVVEINESVAKFLGKTGTAWYQIYINTRGLMPRTMTQIEEIAGNNLSSVVEHFANDWQSFNIPNIQTFVETLPESEDTAVEYEVTSELIESYEPVTLEQIESIVDEWDYDGWTLTTELKFDEVRVYANRDGSDELTPSVYTDWTMVTSDYGYIIVAQEVEHVTV
jgi:hypothetical protein